MPRTTSANSIHPHGRYPLHALLFNDPEKARRAGAAAGQCRWAPDQDTDVANAVLYLASEEASFINGVSLPVDGGVTCY